MTGKVDYVKGKGTKLCEGAICQHDKLGEGEGTKLAEGEGE